MAWTRDFRAGLIKVHMVGMADPAYVGGVTSIRLQSNSEIRKERSASSVYADVATVASVRPTMQFTSQDIASALTALAWSGTCMTADGTHPGLVAYGAKHDCSGIAAGSVHDSYTMAQGIVVPRTLSVDHRGNAEITYEALSSWDGTLDPVVRAASVALPTAVASNRYTMEDLTIQGVSVAGKRQISIDFGHQIAQEGADSEPFDSVASIQSVQPVLTVRGVDTSWFTTVAPLLGKSATLATTVLSLQKRGVAKATAAHIKISFSGTVSWDTIFDGSPDSPAQAAFRLDCIFDGTNAPVTVQTNQAIN